MGSRESHNRRRIPRLSIDPEAFDRKIVKFVGPGTQAIRPRAFLFADDLEYGNTSAWSASVP